MQKGTPRKDGTLVFLTWSPPPPPWWPSLGGDTVQATLGSLFADVRKLGPPSALGNPALGVPTQLQSPQALGDLLGGKDSPLCGRTPAAPLWPWLFARQAPPLVPDFITRDN